ncbi:heme ABC transporter ATP-binding protein/permease CydC [Ferrimonas balearica]|uniref:heme ABC transporter ATP-binding protein/permease CydC n=1 Tax=Ferrimonas balearica TaxID=44012 RepID=UPI001C9A0B8A|nr:cysteine/glutathione ABC transporter ATP-binding protein/permease CydC [Ferrimonas balearica]MBY5920330.1 cysteine/glutathione ABC transporter ATP-binding protein/permease CydC [Ferrimonas balearica]MBY5996985.1 cysteine/glutathione ABC transporter ATP-binding protein/permease CydC [Ferrimonas balearica]
MGDLKPFLALYRQHWGRLSLGILLAVLTLLGSIGLLSLSGWFIAATAVAGLVITRSAEFNYMMPAGGVRFLSVSRTVARWGERVVSHDATFRLLATLRNWFFQRLAPLGPGQLKDLRDADLLNRMVADIDALDHLYLRLITPVVAGAISILALMGLIAFFDGQLALILGGTLFALLALFPLVFYRLGLKPGEALSERLTDLRLHLGDWLEAQSELAVFGATENQRSKLHQQESALVAGQRSMAHLTGFSQALITTLNGWVLLMMVVLGWQQIGAATPPGPLLALLVFATLASFEALAPVANAFQHLGHTLTAARRLRPILEMTPDQTFGELSAPKAFETLSLKAIQYRYEGGLDPVIHGLNLTLSAGEKVAILGKTGCGKSTLLDLLTRQFSPKGGEIELNGQPVEAYSHSALSQTICHISQRVHLFNDTLADNLRLARPGASDEELISALEKVELGYLAADNGLTQWLGEGGRQLSGGERRRLGLARALLHPAPVLLLDEPTEGLDEGTESRVLAAMLAHQPNRTLLYITHRRAALEQMDRVYTMDNGCLTPTVN